jgi:putative SOS response-associated peptidase YedK
MNGKKRKVIKQPYLFFKNSSAILIAAGLYWNRSSGDIESSIITREAATNLQVIHNRSPLLLNEEKRNLWVSDNSSEEIYSEILDFTYNDIIFHKVDRAVSSPKNNNESLIQEFKEVPF